MLWTDNPDKHQLKFSYCFSLGLPQTGGLRLCMHILVDLCSDSSQKILHCEKELPHQRFLFKACEHSHKSLTRVVAPYKTDVNLRFENI